MNNLYYMDAESLHEMQANMDKAQEGLSMADFVNVRKERSIDEQGIATIDIRGVMKEDAPKLGITAGPNFATGRRTWTDVTNDRGR